MVDNKNLLQKNDTGVSAKDRTIRLIIDIVVISFGLAISSFGTALFYAAELGSSPMATFCDGLHNVLNVSYGTANTITNIVLLVILLYYAKSYINVGTVLCVFTIGFWVNIFTPMLVGLMISQLSIGLRVMATVLGTLLMGVGLGLYVAVDRGFGALEGLVKVFCQRKNVSFTKAKIFQDILLVGGGMLLSAKWGVGTLIAIFLTGPVIQWSIKTFGRIIPKRNATVS